MRYWTVGLAYLGVYAFVGWALGAYPYARSIFGVVGVAIAALAVVVVVLARRRNWSGCQRIFWNIIAIGMALWLVGHAGWAYDALVRHETTWLGWHTLFTLCGSICPLLALVARPHRGIRTESVPEVGFDVASYGLLALFIYAYFVLIPSPIGGTAGAQVTLFAIIQANQFLLLAAVAVFAWTAWRTRWRATYLRLAAGIAFGFFPRIAASVAIERGTYQAGTLYDLAWVTPWLCYAWAAAESPSSEGEMQRVSVPSRALPAVFGAFPVFAIPLIGYTWLQTGSIGDPGDTFRALLTSVVTVAGLGLVTLRLASQSDELQRADSRLELLAAATEQTRDLILFTRADGRVEYANDAFLKALGYSRDELASMVLRDLTDPASGFDADEMIATVRDHGVWRGTIIRRRRDGTTFPAWCTAVALKDARGTTTHYVGVERDVSDELMRRDQLVRAERLSAMTELVAGVAHEINNPLQTVIGAAELMLEEAPVTVGADAQGDARRRDLELVRSEAGRAGQIVRNLLAFIRRSAPDRALADLNDIVRVTVELRRYRLHQWNISITLRCEAGPLPVMVNREEIQQIILNLLLNAEQAIGGADGESGTSRPGTIAVQTGRTAASVFAEVTDDGPGVSPELRGRIFEPFFTTKQVGQGTGLGLSVSHGIASAHGGSLELRPSPSGASFRLTLPLPTTNS